MKKMQAGVLSAPGKISSKEVEIEDLKDGEILVKVDACGICESDLDIFREDPLTAKFWGGHEISGRVVELGPGASGPQVGTRVSVMPTVACGECEECKSGKEDSCSKLSFIGFDRPGGFAEFIAVPGANLFELPEATDPIFAVLVGSLASVIHSTSIAGDLKDKNVVVFGADTIGLITVLVARLQGARSVSAVGRYFYQRDIAKRSGAEMVFDSTSPTLAKDIKERIQKKVNTSADVVIETLGAEDRTTIADSIELLKPGGVVVLCGVHCGREKIISENRSEKEIDVRYTQRYNREDFGNAVELIKRCGIRVFDLAPILTHRVDIDEIPRAYDIALSKEIHRTIKVVVKP